MRIKKRYPVGEQVIPVYYDSGRRWFTHEHVTVYRFEGRCTRDNCPNDAEHVTFDGQVFFRRSVR